MKATFSDFSVDGNNVLSITVSYCDGNGNVLLTDMVKTPMALFSESSLRLAVNQKLSLLSTPSTLTLSQIQAALASGVIL